MVEHPDDSCNNKYLWCLHQWSPKEAHVPQGALQDNP